ncbi:MAG: sigma factor-like helix-turn-helix DNA-binding protein [Cyclobacteriaceae bacterium]
MTSVITGDIIGSRKVDDPEAWMSPLKTLFKTQGPEPAVWQFFRGDSFQLEVKNVEDVLMIALKIKAAVKCIKNLNIKIAIGIGSKNYDAPAITESNGEAFIYSGELFDRMKKKNLAIKTPWIEFDKQMNLYFDLAMLTMDRWTQNSAEIVKLSLNLPNLTQRELGEKLGITQGRVSDRQKRAGFEEMLKMEKRFRELVKQNI